MTERRLRSEQGRGDAGAERSEVPASTLLERAVAVVGFVLLCAAAVFSGVLELLFVPLYAGSVLVPVVVAAAFVGGLALTRLGFALLPTASGAVVPFVCWLLPVLGLALYQRPEGDVLVLGAGGQQYVFYGVVGFGIVAGLVNIVRLTTPAPRPPSGSSARGAGPLSR